MNKYVWNVSEHHAMLSIIIATLLLISPMQQYRDNIKSIYQYYIQLHIIDTTMIMHNCNIISRIITTSGQHTKVVPSTIFVLANDLLNNCLIKRSPYIFNHIYFIPLHSIKVTCIHSACIENVLIALRNRVSGILYVRQSTTYCDW